MIQNVEIWRNHICRVGWIGKSLAFIHVWVGNWDLDEGLRY